MLSFKLVALCFFLYDLDYLISLDSLIFLARISNTVLTRAGKSEQSYLIPELGRKYFSIPLLSVMLAVDFVNVYFSCTYLLIILKEREFNFCQVLSFIYGDDHMSSVPQYLNKYNVLHFYLNTLKPFKYFKINLIMSLTPVRMPLSSECWCLTDVFDYFCMCIHLGYLSVVYLQCPCLALASK